MDSISKQTQLQYKGYFDTPLLWEKHPVLTLNQLELPKEFRDITIPVIPENLVLGKRVEKFVYQELNAYFNINILLENVQIQDQKITIGEIDCILLKDKQALHLEIVYKYYLFDPVQGNTELENWVGPNKNDSLIAKLKKLKSKQLPLAYHQLSEPVLNEVGVDPQNLKQYVYFKAQLFIPYELDTIDFKLLNKDCIRGFYISIDQLNIFNSCDFYIPSKADWLVNTHANVAWMAYNIFYEKVLIQVENQKSPLCWIRFLDGMVQKFFVVFW